MLQPQLFRFVTDLLPAWCKPHRRVLALGVAGLLAKRRLTLTTVARGLPSTCRIIHRVKRLWRFVNNPAVDPRTVTTALVAHALALRPTGWLPVILDDTSLKDRLTLLGAAIPYHGRALPLALYSFAPQLLPHSLWRLREGLLALILAALPADTRPRLLLVADRGFAASHFFCRLIRTRINFVIRVPRKVLLHMHHQSHSLEFLVAELQPGQRVFLTNVGYGPQRARLNLLLWWHPAHQEPWLLATTLPDAAQACRYYRLRMRIEAQFKDFKQQFRPVRSPLAGLEDCQLQTRDRITRMCLLLLLALWVLALRIRYPASWVRWITARGTLSFVSLALEWLDAPPPIRTSLRQGRKSG